MYTDSRGRLRMAQASPRPVNAAKALRAVLKADIERVLGPDHTEVSLRDCSWPVHGKIPHSGPLALYSCFQLAVQLDDIHRPHSTPNGAAKEFPQTVLTNFILDPDGDCNYISLDVLESLGYKGSKKEDVLAWIYIHDMMVQCRILPHGQTSRLCHQFLCTNGLYYYYCAEDHECILANREPDGFVRR